MVTWADVSPWKADGIGQIGDHLAAQNRQVLGLQDELDGAKPAGWAGEAAEAAAENLRARCQELEDLAARLSAAVKIIDDTEQAVRDLVRSLETTEDFAVKNGFRIDNGKVVKTENSTGFLSSVLLQVEVEAILARAGEIDTELNSVLKRILSGEIGDAGATTLAAAAAAGEGRIADEQRHRDLLAKYQVKADGTTVWRVSRRRRSPRPRRSCSTICRCARDCSD